MFPQAHFFGPKPMQNHRHNLNHPRQQGAWEICQHVIGAPQPIPNLRDSQVAMRCMSSVRTQLAGCWKGAGLDAVFLVSMCALDNQSGNNFYAFLRSLRLWKDRHLAL